MYKQIDTIFKNPLFKGIKKENREEIYELLDLQLKNYSCNQYVFQAGKNIKRAALLLEGEVILTRRNFWGEDSLIQTILPGELFALTISSNASISSDMDAKCTQASVILWFDVQDILQLDHSNNYTNLLARNLLAILAKQNNMLKLQLWNMSQKNTRSKILSYLSSLASTLHQEEFDIPYNRQELAIYLGVDRSAMSTELNKLQKEGYFLSNKNHFRLLKKEDF